MRNLYESMQCFMENFSLFKHINYVLLLLLLFRYYSSNFEKKTTAVNWDNIARETQFAKINKNIVLEISYIPNPIKIVNNVLIS